MKDIIRVRILIQEMIGDEFFNIIQTGQVTTDKYKVLSILEKHYNIMKQLIEESFK